MKAVVIISTHNRRDLTGITLDAIMACKRPEAPVYVIDDSSVEYTTEWLYSFGVTGVVESCVWNTLRDNDHLSGVGRMARNRLEVFYGYTGDLGDDGVGILLDNDALVAPGFDVEAMRLVKLSRLLYGDDGVLATLYRSSAHPSVYEDKELSYVAMEHIGGISLVVDRAGALRLLGGEINWGHEWDWQLHKAIPNIIAPMNSYVEHIGRHGGGVNGQSDDRAINFLGYHHRCGLRLNSP